MNKFVLVLNTFDIKEYENYDTIESYIVGNNKFGIRLPKDFEISNIKELKKKSNKKILIAVNKIFHEYEIEDLKEYLKQLKEINVDGIIFSDFAVYKIVKDLKWDTYLSYSTDTTITSASFSNLAKENKIDNIELAKELTLKEIKEINEKKDSSLTLFIHGHIYMYNSFRNIISSYFNNYDFQKPEEDLYLFDEEREAYYPILESKKGTHILSSYDQMSIKFIKDIFSLNVEFLKLDSFGYNEEDFIFIFKKYNDLLNLFNENVKEDIFDLEVKKTIKEIEEKVDYKKFNTGFLKKKTIF